MNQQKERQSISPTTQDNKLPKDSYSGVAADFADLFGRYLETPRTFLYFSFLTTLGNMLSDRLTLKSELRPQPRVFTLLIGSSGDDRKSSSLNATVGFFKQTFESGINVCWGLGSAEGLSRRLKELNPSRLLLCFDEFRAFISKCKIDTSVLLPAITSLFENNHFQSYTKTTSIELDKSYISMIACTTMEIFDNLFNSQVLDIGLLNRLLLVSGSGRRKFAIPQVIPNDEKKEIQKKLAGIVKLIDPYLEMEITSGAFKIYESWYLNLEQSIFATRIDTIALRLLPLLAVNDGKTLIDEETVWRVINLCDWQIRARKRLSPIIADNLHAAIQQKIKRVLEKRSMTRRELYQFTNAGRTGTEIFDRGLKGLMKSRVIGKNSKDGVYFLREIQTESTPQSY